MSEPATVQAAIASVMADLPAIGKDGKAAPQQGGYAYRGIEQITKATQELFAKYGVVIVPAVQSVHVDHLTVNNKPWTDTRLVVNYAIVGPDGSTLNATTVGIGRDNADKGANKAMSQAFKYLLLQLLCISDAKDDADGQTHEADSRNPEPTYSAEAVALFGEIRGLDDDDKQALLAFANGDKGQLTVAHLDEHPVWRAEVERKLDELKAAS